MKKLRNLGYLKDEMQKILSIILVTIVATGTIFYLTTITDIEKIYANQNTDLNFTGFDVTVTSHDNIPDWLLDDIKNNIMKSFMTFSNNNNISQIQIDITTDEGTNKDDMSKANIILTSHKYVENEDSNYDDIIGTVKNIGSGTAEYVKIIMNFYDNNLDIVATDDRYADPKTLNPGQKSPFSYMLNKKEIQDAANYEISLSWDNADGTEGYVENVNVTKDNQSTLNENIKNSDEEQDEDDDGS